MQSSQFRTRHVLVHLLNQPNRESASQLWRLTYCYWFFVNPFNFRLTIYPFKYASLHFQLIYCLTKSKKKMQQLFCNGVMRKRLDIWWCTKKVFYKLYCWFSLFAFFAKFLNIHLIFLVIFCILFQFILFILSILFILISSFYYTLLYFIVFCI